MVTAGVYMVVRSNVLFRLSPTAMAVVATVGAITAIFAATIGIAQNDIKKVLAYSTVSQLGYMFLAAGVGAFTAAIFHVMTHAFFKACLFLGAGSVIHGCGGEQDMRKMGGLRKYMPRTHWTMLVATIAIAGHPAAGRLLLEGRDPRRARSRIRRCSGSSARSPPGLTAFYMFRLYFMTFRGSLSRRRGRRDRAVGAGARRAQADPRQASSRRGRRASRQGARPSRVHVHEPHESPLSMTGVLAVLAVLSIVGGFIGLPAALGGPHPTWFQRWLEPVLLPLQGHAFHFHEATLGLEWTLMVISVAIAVLGIFVARSLYLRRPAVPDVVETKLGRLYVVLANKYYVDEIYNAVFVRGTLLLSMFLSWFDAHVIDGLVNLTRHITLFGFGHGSNLFDKYIVDGLVNGVATLTGRGSAVVRRMQTGLVQNYALVDGRRHRPARSRLSVSETVSADSQELELTHGHSEHRHLHPAGRRGHHPVLLPPRGSARSG